MTTRRPRIYALVPSTHFYSTMHTFAYTSTPFRALLPFQYLMVGLGGALPPVEVGVVGGGKEGAQT